MVTDDNKLQAVKAYNYFRVGSYDDPDEVVGHIIAYVYYEPTKPNDLLDPHAYKSPNRIRVIKYKAETDTEPEINTTQTFIFSGDEVSIGTIGEPITPLEPAGITALCVLGQDDSWYDDAKRVVSQYMIRLTNNERVKNKADNRPLVVPNNITIASVYKTGENKTIEQTLTSIRDETDPIIGIDPTYSGNFGFIGDNFDFASEQAGLEYLAQLGYIISGLPITSWGVNIGAGESGFAREKAQDNASARIRSLRLQISKCLPILINALGAPDGEVSFTWSTSPFEDRAAKANQLLSWYNAGLIDENEFREAVGLSRRTVSNAAETNENDNEEVE